MAKPLKSPKEARRAAEAAGWLFCVRDPALEPSGFTYATLAAAEAVMCELALTAPRAYRLESVQTGNWLDDYDAPNGRHYLTARQPDGAPVRSVRYYPDGTEPADRNGAVHSRAEALLTAAWALSTPRLGRSDFDPRKTWGDK